MRLGDEYQEYSEPQLFKPSKATHKWLLIDKAPKVMKYRCSKCKATKTTYAYADRHPLVRYQVEGVVTEGKAPGCSQSAKACES